MIAYVPSAVLRIGRGTNAELRLDDIAVALEHAVIEPVERGYRLLDRGSATGTYLNGKAVHEALLSANDLINIGGYDIRVQITDPEDPLFLSVRASAPVVAPPAATTVAPPSVVAAMVQAAVAQEAAARKAAAQEAAREAAHGAAQGAAPGAATAATPAGPPAGQPAWEVASGEGGTPAEGATMRMSPEALAAALRAATAMAAAARAAAARPAAGSAAEPATGPVAAPAAGPAAVPAADSGAAPAAETAPATGSAALAAAAGSAPSPPVPPSPRQPSPAVPALRAPVIDYLGAYSLRRPLFNKALLALVLTAGAAAALLFLARSGRAIAFEPGRVHVWHAETACASCHSPWRGPDPALCSDCHARQREKGEIHQARQTLPPPCTDCHPDGAAPPLPLSEAMARRADPTPLRFNHQRHLRAGLPTPSGQRVQLGC